MKIFLIRHGETIDNIRGRIQGWKGGDLTKKGILQARDVGIYLKKTGCKYLYTSDLRRCMQTTNQIKRILPNIIIKKKSGLRERRWGFLEGKQYPDLVKLLQINHISYDKYTPPGAESWKNFSNRTWDCIKKISAEHVNENVAIVTSGGVSSIIVGRLLGKDFKKSLAIKQSQGCINILQNKGKTIILENKNLKAHLRGNKSRKKLLPYI